MILCAMSPGLKRLPARFYRSESGREPVREWLKGLEPEDRKAIGEDIKDVEFSWPIGMPLVRSLGRMAELHELFSASSGSAWSCFTALSKKPKRRRDVTSTWR
jgi:hypothetical protein